MTDAEKYIHLKVRLAVHEAFARLDTAVAAQRAADEADEAALTARLAELQPSMEAFAKAYVEGRLVDPPETIQ